jgi:hypothetical protein
MIIGNSESHPLHTIQQKPLVIGVATLLIALVAGTGGYLLGQRTVQKPSQGNREIAFKSSPSPPREPSDAPPPSILPSVAGGEWKTYINTTYGYLLKYPANWQRNVITQELVGFTPDPIPDSGVITSPFSSYPFRVNVHTPQLGQTIDSFKSQAPGSQEQNVQLAGTTALELSNGFGANYIFKKGRYFIEISTTRDQKAPLAVINTMLSTFHFRTNAGKSTACETPTMRDFTPLAITVSASPEILWPSDGRMVPVTIRGKITDNESAVNPDTAVYDAGGSRGSLPLKPDGSYSFTIQLQAGHQSKIGFGPAGESHQIFIEADDYRCNHGSAYTSVSAPN